GADTPRRAGISAFGAGGVNAHVVLEEYISTEVSPDQDNTLGEIQATPPSVFVLSARDEERLKAYALAMADFLDTGLENGELPDLADIAYTSQVGRDPMEERLAIVTDSTTELRDKLNVFGREGRREDGVFRGNVKRDKETLTLFTEDEDFGALLGKWVRQENYRKLLSLWTKGLEFDWNRLHGEQRPGRVSLPTYPFAENRYWIESDPVSGRRIHAKVARAAHPLLHENTSDFSEQRFSSVFTGDEPFITDDSEFKVLSPSVQLEMARAATIRSAEGVTNVVITDVTGFKPLAIEQDTLEIHIGLFPESGGDLGFEIYVRTEDEADVYTSGRIVPDTEASAANDKVIDLAGVKAECERDPMDALGEFAIGEGCLRELHPGKDVALARLTLPDERGENTEAFGLHPAMMDTALNVATSLMDDTDSGAGLQTLAFEMDRLEMRSGCLPDMWAVIRWDGGTVHVELCDETGTVRVRMKGFRGLDIEPAESAAPVQTDEPTTLMTFEEVLRKADINGDSGHTVKTLLCVLNESDSRDQVAAVLEGLAPETNSVIITIDDDYHSVIEQNGPDAVLYLADSDTAAEVATDIQRLLKVLAAVDNSAPVRFLLAAQLPEGPAFCHGDSWVGFARSLPMVMPKLQFGVIVREKNDEGDVLTMSQWVNILWQELHAGNIESAVYRGDERYVYRNREMESKAPEQFNSLITSGNAYMITGGCGGLGGLLARYLVTTYDINLVLTGRSPKNEKIQQLLDDLGSANRFAKVAYVQADICDAAALKKGLAEAGEDFRAVAGVIHAAGIESDGDLLGKDSDAFNRVLRPKIEGCLALEAAFGDQPLDFVCYYSSTSAVLGDFGACDYAIANRFMAAFARYKAKGKSAVKHIAIHWPLWRDGGMGFDFDGGAEMYLKSSGQRLLETAEGTELFDRLIARDGSRHLVLAGVPRRLRRFMGLEKPEPVPEISVVPVTSGRRAEMKGLSLAQCLETDLKLQISSLLGIDVNLLDADANLADFGFDSILFAKFADALTEFYGTEITPSIFFGNPSIERLVHYFLEKHAGLMEGFYEESRLDTENYQSQPEVREQRLAKAPVTPRRRTARFLTTAPGDAVSDDIAIIGMSGRFPQARNIDEMWDILKGGKDAVTEIPIERFDWRRYYGPGSESVMVSNRCGIVPGASEFDPSFFEISPKEAKGMDPRQRLLLQESWRALEDAGYGPAHLRNNRMGIFVGMESGGSGGSEYGEKGITSDHEGVSAVRLAYFLNFHGPAMAINTSCSSGLVAAHQACQSLRTSECDTAIAAGVNLMLHPDTFVGLSRSGMMSPSGKCFAFDRRADGMVPGEAVVSLVLKRLSDAERDNDPVYAVIRGSAINYDGKTNGITAPNQDAQAELMKTVYDRYQIDPRDIAHIVTHGTGTKLGDSIEINALADAFKDYSGDERFCALTSTKTNFGHCFAASGLVSLVSLVQAIRHETIPRSIHFSEENDHITWKDSPFYVNAETKPWPSGNGMKRLGAVSAFGMSGTNAHMVVESHDGRSRNEAVQTEPAYLLVFSAKQETVLEDKIREMAAYLETSGVKTAGLGGICSTLSAGRHHFKHRAAIVVQDVDDAVHV
ncbi:MAG: SDR family NAD(P)-dependent oxidoreductase, partial [Desulfobacterales bacterium]|nr:SDR family NAD(P)-dependent oxidoreductase [Desulfobacterales bacterium]